MALAAFLFACVALPCGFGYTCRKRDLSADKINFKQLLVDKRLWNITDLKSDYVCFLRNKDSSVLNPLHSKRAAHATDECVCREWDCSWAFERIVLFTKSGYQILKFSFVGYQIASGYDKLCYSGVESKYFVWRSSGRDMFATEAGMTNDGT